MAEREKKFKIHHTNNIPAQLLKRYIERKTSLDNDRHWSQPKQNERLCFRSKVKLLLQHIPEIQRGIRIVKIAPSSSNTV